MRLKFITPAPGRLWAELRPTRGALQSRLHPGPGRSLLDCRHPTIGKDSAHPPPMSENDEQNINGGFRRAKQVFGHLVMACPKTDVFGQAGP